MGDVSARFVASGEGGAEGADQARRFLEQAIQLDPLFAVAHAALAFVHVYSVSFGIALSLSDALAQREAEAQKAMELDPDEPAALVALAWVAFSKGDLDAAARHSDQAISVDPNYAGAYVTKGAALVYSGRTSEGRSATMIALRLSPRDPMGAIMLLLLAVADYHERNYVDALEAARCAIRDYPDYPIPYGMLAASLGQLGRADEAREALQRAIAISPETFGFYVRSPQPWHRQEDWEHVQDGIRKAGWQG